jgi:aryl-alcohol dehydrogenase-like predicted oxidoreductase
MGSSHGVEPGVIAIAWTLSHSAVTADTVGARRPDQVDGVLPAATLRLIDTEAGLLESFLRANP